MTGETAGQFAIRNDPTWVETPYTIFNIELTNRCPFKCIMCARTHNMTRAQGLMDFDLFRKVIDEYVQDSPEQAMGSECWMHHFGESLVHPEFDHFIAYASARGVFTALSLNPLCLTSRPWPRRAATGRSPSSLHRPRWAASCLQTRPGWSGWSR